MKFCDLVIAAGCLTVASHASAASLGPSQGGVILGAPIDLFFEVQGDGPQASAENECVAAQVWLGDVQLPNHQVRITPRTHQVRLQTTTAVNEPLITIKLTAGCASTIARSYTLFADPPKSLAAVQTPIDLQKITVAPLAQSSSQFSAPVIKAAPAKVAKPKPKAKPRPQAQPEKVAPTPPAPASAPATAETAGKPTLRLNPVLDLEPSTPAQTAAVDAASATAIAAGVAAADISSTPAAIDPNAQRLEALEQQLQKMQEQLRSTHAETDALRTQLAKANASASATPTWVYALLGLLALALACIAWLLQRLKQEQEKAQQAWSRAVAAETEPTDAIPARAEVMSTPMPASLPPAVANISAATVASAAPVQAVAPSPQTSYPSQDLAQLLTAQALLEVQEEAEFYASIGENDQAIALLEAHIEAHENSSPLAYLELLQLLHRLSRTEAFERTREQFERNFSVQVPGFLGFANKGGDLWNYYPEVLAKIEAAWPSDAIQPLLRDLILNQEPKAGESGIRFDLAAFDDLLMLYNLAKSTTATERGVMDGRLRSTLAQAPLPDLQLDTTPSFQIPEAEFISEDIFSVPVAHTESVSPEPSSLSDLMLDFPAPLPASTDASPKAINNDSPFKDTSHFTSDEILMDSLTLDWQETPATATHNPKHPNLPADNALDWDAVPPLAPLPPAPPTK